VQSQWKDIEFFKSQKPIKIQSKTKRTKKMFYFFYREQNLDR